MSFVGFSEEELRKIKSHETVPAIGLTINSSAVKKIEKIGAKPRRLQNPYKLPELQKQTSNEINDLEFTKCKLSSKSPVSPINTQLNTELVNKNDNLKQTSDEINDLEFTKCKLSSKSPVSPINTQLNTELVNKNDNLCDLSTSMPELNLVELEEKQKSPETTDINSNLPSRKFSSDSAPDIVRGVVNYTEDDLAAHKIKLQDLQLKQKIMEEQNKKRKEMLAKALADRKQYLRVEKEFLQAKINLQKEKEKKELLTEHLCALITHNETRKAQKLETLMQELAADRKVHITATTTSIDDDDEPVIIDGVDQKTGKIVELPATT
ncbi:hypothetical protein ACJJTC_013325 [Scirpophaga incertulas]